MKIVLPNIRLPFNHDEDQIVEMVSKKLRIPPSIITNIEVDKVSVDARRKPTIYFVYTLMVSTKNNVNDNNIRKSGGRVFKYKAYKFPFEKVELESRPVIVGSGPAGLFCGLTLAREGYNPIIIERGQEASKRYETIKEFNETGKLNPESNITFGEGGAGTFSDGKLYTGVKDKFLRKQLILDALVEFGADSAILQMAKPHVGTDYLVNIVENMRKEIIKLGGEVHFNSKVVDMTFEGESIVSVTAEENGQLVEYKSNNIVLAIGHSSRDTFRKLYEKKIKMEAKPFAIGLRIEHPQAWIDHSQYGEEHYEDTRLPVADYKLTYNSKSGRGVYTFCMCPGGYVVNSSTDAGMLVCNGMSLFNRDNKNANSAVIVNVGTEDFSNGHEPTALDGIAFQEKWERKAYELSDSFNLPTQSFKDFYKDVKGQEYTNSALTNDPFFGEEEIGTTVVSGTVEAHLNQCLPSDVSETLIEGIIAFGKKLKGFDHPNSRLVGVETRTSSPVKILRDDAFMSSIKGLYPCGEGAGYAGGIMSAAIDGIKVAEKIVENSTK